MMLDGLEDAYEPGRAMGTFAEDTACEYQLTRQQQDEFAYRSQMKAKAALEKKAFADEIVPVRAIAYQDGKRVFKDFTVDEMPRGDTTVEGLAKLPAVFAVGGSVTAGNSSPISDGAAAALVMSRAKADELGVKPLHVRLAYKLRLLGSDPDAIVRQGMKETLNRLKAGAET